MKKLLSIFLVMMLGFSVFAYNAQTIIPVGSEVYDWIKAIYISSGHSLPSSSGPWSAAELEKMLDKVDYSGLSDNMKALYDKAWGTVSAEEDLNAFNLNFDLFLETYLHTNQSEHFLGRDAWIRGWDEMKPFFKFSTDAYVDKYYYGYFEFTLGNSKTFTVDGNPDTRPWGSSSFNNNIPMVPPNDMKQLDFNIPYRAFVSAGSSSITVQMGRDNLSWGAGTTGNLILGDQLGYHNLFRVAAFTENFKWTFLLSFFPHPQNYYNASGYNRSGENGQSQYINGIKFFMAHRLEWRMLKDKLNFTLTEGVMYMSKDNRLDLIVLNPSMLYHNNYTRSLTNSILGFEFDGTPVKGLNLYLSFVIDESVLPGEPNPVSTVSEPAEPNGRGFIGGATYILNSASGYFHFNLEGAYTDPYLYLRDGDLQPEGGLYREQRKGLYGINYVVAVREQANCGGTTVYDEKFMGYQYGGDAIVANLNMGYSQAGLFDLSANIFYMLHGTHDQFTVWTRINNNTFFNQLTPTTTHQTENQNDDDVSDRDSVEKTLVLGVNGSWNFAKGFRAYAQADLVMVTNPNNSSANEAQKDFQLTTGLSYSF